MGQLGFRVVILAAAVLTAVVPISSGCVEHVYSRSVYRMLQRVLTPMSNRVGLALFDILVVSVVVALVVWWVVRIRSALPELRLRAVLAMIFNTAAVAAGVYLVFLALWGLNYRRVPLKQKLDFQESRVTRDALIGLTRESVAELNQLHTSAHEASWPEPSQLTSALAAPFTRAQRQLPSMPAAVPGMPKRSILSLYFRSAAINGMTDPFFLEILVNDDVLPFEQPFVVAHEWAHLAGYADEAEANFVGWLTCQSGTAAVRYSGWLFLFPQLLRQLPEADRADLTAPLAAGPREDLEAIAQRFRRSTPFVRRQADRVYDGFLKANRVAEGIASYGGVVELVLGTRLGR